ncbi:MAG TPA: ROK family protein [Nitrososphaeria archaeon]|nr:ROK family protein [Nitrososphaeria archaeon]
MAESLVVGIDLGATNIRAALGSLSSGIIRKLRRRTVGEKAEDAVSKQLIDLVREVAGRELEKVQAIGIGSIGPIDVWRGAILNPPNAPFRNVPIAEALSEEFKVPAYLVNDCAAAVLGERCFGAGKGLENLVYVTLSSGIGGGAIVDGNLLLGKDGNAAEIGHIVVDLEGRLTCNCGGRGHWEAYCSGRGIPAFAKYLMEEDPEAFRGSRLMRLAAGGKLSPESVFELAKSGDRGALKVVEEVGRLNAMGFASIINVYDPELITVGGSITLNNQPLILNPILGKVKEYSVNRLPELRVTPLGEDVVLYGAIALASNPPAKLSSKP